MQITYVKPRNIKEEIEEILYGNRFYHNGLPIKEITLTKEEQAQLYKELSSTWNDARDKTPPCFRVDEDNDPYNGGYDYLTWTGEWGVKRDDKVFWVKILEESVVNKDVLDYAAKLGA